jgi:hypothetical protein
MILYQKIRIKWELFRLKKKGRRKMILMKMEKLRRRKVEMTLKMMEVKVVSRKKKRKILKSKWNQSQN